MTFHDKLDLMRHSARLSLMAARVAASKRPTDPDADRRVRLFVTEAREAGRAALALRMRQAAR